jgi:DUF4097 and DUF4098 domain-containing protein YvlB
VALVPLAGQNRPGNRTVTVSGNAPAAAQLRIEAGGPVTLESGVSPAIAFTATAAVNARTDGEGRALLESRGVRAGSVGEWMVLSTASGVTLTVKAPRLAAVSISSSGGPVSASGIAGTLEVRSLGGDIAADRIGGNCDLITGGGDIRVGRVEAGLHSVTGAGRITVESAHGETVLASDGGDIEARDVGGPVNAQTAAGTIRIGNAGGSVTAVTGGGQIVIGKAGGVVTARSMAGQVLVGGAAGLRCESGNGGIQAINISGAMRVSTEWGNIVASLLGGRQAESALSTGNGDITVTIPSNVGVTIRAENDMADTIRRIVSEFPGIPVRMRGMRVVAEGAVNGGGPVLRISDMGGTIFIRRQQ